MARTRLLKPEFFRSEDIAALSMASRLFFQGLWGIADKDGRLLDRPRRLAAEIFPYDVVDGEGMLAELAANPGLIIRYAAPDGRRCIQITNFTKHQSPHFREPSLGLPGPNECDVGQSLGLSRQATEKREMPPPSGSGSGSGFLSGEGKDPSPPAKWDFSSEPPAIWPAGWWLVLFKAAWRVKYAVFYGAGEADARASRDLDEQLQALPPDERLKAQAESQAYFAAYFASLNAPGHPWKWFVERLNTFRTQATGPPVTQSRYQDLTPRKIPTEAA